MNTTSTDIQSQNHSSESTEKTNWCVDFPSPRTHWLSKLHWSAKASLDGKFKIWNRSPKSICQGKRESSKILAQFKRSVLHLASIIFYPRPSSENKVIFQSTIIRYEVKNLKYLRTLLMSRLRMSAKVITAQEFYATSLSEIWCRSVS